MKQEALSHGNEHSEWRMRLDELSTDTLMQIIATDFLQIEARCYRGGRSIPAEDKLLFLIGGPHKDVRMDKGFDGHAIYTKEASHPKAPEIMEAAAAISAHFEQEANLPRVLSEVSDVVYNLVQLTKLDTNFSESYMKCIEKISGSMGLSVRDLLLVTVVKYAYRMSTNEGSKDVKAEEGQIARLLAVDGDLLDTPLSEPTSDQIGTTYRILNEMEDGILQSRFDQLKRLWVWESKPPAS